MDRIRLQQFLGILLLAGLSTAIVIENEELLDISEQDMAGLNPVRKPGTLSVQSLPPNALCVDCLLQAKAAIDRYNQYIYLSYYQSMPNVTNSDQLTGVKSCREFAEVENCFNQCKSSLTTDESQRLEQYNEVKTLAAYQHLLCEARYTPGYASCRLADAQRCNKIRRNNCGNNIVEYQECVDEILYRSGQNCSGYCTPARRYLRVQEFVWDMECSLQATYKSQCKDIVTIFCFEPVKDTELNYGYYQDIDTIPAMANNLENACEILQSPFECMETATYGFYDYFGLNVTYACRGAEETMDDIRAYWQTLIDPFCGGNVSTVNRTIEDACPIPDPANAPPEIPVRIPLTTTTTTERTWEFYQPKEGRCPIATGTREACDTLCGDDSHCAGTMRCCDACCKEPLRRPTSRRPQITPSPNPVRRRTDRPRATGKARPRATAKTGPRATAKAISEENESNSGAGQYFPCLTLMLLLLLPASLLRH